MVESTPIIGTPTRYLLVIPNLKGEQRDACNVNATHLMQSHRTLSAAGANAPAARADAVSSSSNSSSSSSSSE